jgi:hypothetical protein
MKHAEVVTGMYLYEGFLSAKRKNLDKPEHYQDLMDKFDGHVGIMAELSEYAVTFTEFFLDPENFELNWPGVLHYEITSDLGEWLFHNLDEPKSAFVTEYTKRFYEWVSK